MIIMALHALPMLALVIVMYTHAYTTRVHISFRTIGILIKLEKHVIYYSIVKTTTIDRARMKPVILFLFIVIN